MRCRVRPKNYSTFTQCWWLVGCLSTCLQLAYSVLHQIFGSQITTTTSYKVCHCGVCVANDIAFLYVCVFKFIWNGSAVDYNALPLVDRHLDQRLPEGYMLFASTTEAGSSVYYSSTDMCGALMFLVMRCFSERIQRVSGIERINSKQNRYHHFPFINTRYQNLNWSVIILFVWENERWKVTGVMRVIDENINNHYLSLLIKINKRPVMKLMVWF